MTVGERDISAGFVFAEADSFLSAVGGDKLSPLQKFEMQKAFFAGFASATGTLDAVLHTIGELGDEKGAELLGSVMKLISDDLQAYSKIQRDIAAKYGITTTRVSAGDGLARPGQADA